MAEAVHGSLHIYINDFAKLVRLFQVSMFVDLIHVQHRRSLHDSRVGDYQFY